MTHSTTQLSPCHFVQCVQRHLNIRQVVHRTTNVFTTLLCHPGAQYVIKSNPKFASTVRQKLIELYMENELIEARSIHHYLFGYDFTVEDVLEIAEKEQIHQKPPQFTHMYLMKINSELNRVLKTQLKT